VPLIPHHFVDLQVVVQYFEPSTTTCLIVPWLRELGFAVLYGALVLKIYRYKLIFHIFVIIFIMFYPICLRRIGYPDHKPPWFRILFFQPPSQGNINNPDGRIPWCSKFKGGIFPDCLINEAKMSTYAFLKAVFRFLLTISSIWRDILKH
jgi:hypothetical protein